MSALLSPTQAKDELPSSSVIAGSAEVTGSPSPKRNVGKLRLSDSELERHIASCGYLLEQAMADYETYHDLASLGSAHRWRILMEQAIKSRSAETIKRMEQDRGLEG